MGTGLLLLVVGILANGAAFFGLRFLAARASGVRGARAVLGMDHGPWVAVPLARKVLFALAGPVGCYLCAAAFVTLGLLMSGRDVVDGDGTRVMVMPGSPAAEAGFVDEDRVVSVNDIPVADWPHLMGAVAGHAGERIRVVVQRQDRQLVLSPTPGPNGRIGVRPAVEHQSIGVGSALGEGLTEPPRVWAAAAKGLVHLVAGRGEHVEAAGPMGIVREVGQASAPRFGNVLRLLGAMTSYGLWIPTLLAFVFFPRRGRRDPSAPHSP